MKGWPSSNCDSLVFELLLEKLLEPQYADGVLVDGFPRTKVQVECIKMLKDKMLELRAQYSNTRHGMHFRRPAYRVAVLFVDELEVRFLFASLSLL